MVTGGVMGGGNGMSLINGFEFEVFCCFCCKKHYCFHLVHGQGGAPGWLKAACGCTGRLRQKRRHQGGARGIPSEAAGLCRLRLA